MSRTFHNLSYVEEIGATKTATDTAETLTTTFRSPRVGARIWECGFYVQTAGSGPRSITANWYEKGLSTNTLAAGPTWTDDDMEAADTAVSHHVMTSNPLEGGQCANTGARIDIQFVHGAEAVTTYASFTPYIIWAL